MHDTSFNEKSLTELLSDLSVETGTLVRQEMELATAELMDKGKKAAAHAGLAGVGGAIAYAGVFVLLAAAVLGLIELGLRPWLAATVVGFVTAATGYFLVDRGINGMRHTSLAPKQTIETLKETARWTTRQGV